MHRKGNTPTLLVEMQIGAVTMENNIEAPQKTNKQNITIQFNNSTLGYIARKKNNTLLKTYMHLSAALFLKFKIWKQLKYP